MKIKKYYMGSNLYKNNFFYLLIFVSSICNCVELCKEGTLYEELKDIEVELTKKQKIQSLFFTMDNKKNKCQESKKSTGILEIEFHCKYPEELRYVFSDINNDGVLDQIKVLNRNNYIILTAKELENNMIMLVYTDPDNKIFADSVNSLGYDFSDFANKASNFKNKLAEANIINDLTEIQKIFNEFKEDGLSTSKHGVIGIAKGWWNFVKTPVQFYNWLTKSDTKLQDLKDIATGLKGLKDDPGLIKKMLADGYEKFKKMSKEEQAEAIGHLTAYIQQAVTLNAGVKAFAKTSTGIHIGNKAKTLFQTVNGTSKSVLGSEKVAFLAGTMKLVSSGTAAFIEKGKVLVLKNPVGEFSKYILVKSGDGYHYVKEGFEDIYFLAREKMGLGFPAKANKDELTSFWKNFTAGGDYEKLILKNSASKARLDFKNNFPKRVELSRAELIEEVTTEPLTGLHSRAAFDNEKFNHAAQLAVALAKRNKKPMSFIMSDLDNFKIINDVYGHDVGDEVLRQMARIFKEKSREMDIPIRYGGEEVLVILPETGKEGVKIAAEKIRKAISESPELKSLYSKLKTEKLESASKLNLKDLGALVDSSFGRNKPVKEIDEIIKNLKNNSELYSGAKETVIREKLIKVLQNNLPESQTTSIGVSSAVPKDTDDLMTFLKNGSKSADLGAERSKANGKNLATFHDFVTQIN